jgi:hypothetical protein
MRDPLFHLSLVLSMIGGRAVLPSEAEQEKMSVTGTGKQV